MPDPVAVNSMFARIARRYDRANFLLSCGIDASWRRRLVAVAEAKRPQDVLDLATGSGDVAFELSRKLTTARSITGVDFCAPMLAEAEAKKNHARGADRSIEVTFRQGDILALPFPDSTYDLVTISFGLRNLADLGRGLREMHRVLRPGGTLLVLEFSQPARVVRPFYYFYLRHVLPRLAGMVTGNRCAYEYLNETIEQFPDREALAREITKAGFQPVTATGLTCGIVALHEATKPAA
jgi:demethylmenaquinone methyltransferase / 2-methoxy-6-polyprenyl-1,4-benzoquinol methylase